MEKGELMTDPWALQRFVIAQDTDGTYDRAAAELRRGRKFSHWMWFVFPQVAGLGQSAMARHYAISGLDEAIAYLEHDVLGPRLLEVTAIVAATQGSHAIDIFGRVDAQKLRSCMTLFLRAGPVEPTFGRVIDRFFDGRTDEATDRLLGPLRSARPPEV